MQIEVHKVLRLPQNSQSAAPGLPWNLHVEAHNTTKSAQQIHIDKFEMPKCSFQAIRPTKFGKQTTCPEFMIHFTAPARKEHAKTPTKSNPLRLPRKVDLVDVKSDQVPKGRLHRNKSAVEESTRSSSPECASLCSRDVLRRSRGHECAVTFPLLSI